MPTTTCDATRVTSTWMFVLARSASNSSKPSVETTPNRQAPRHTAMCVRSPAGCSLASRSAPMAAPRTTATSRRSTASSENRMAARLPGGQRVVVAAVDRRSSTAPRLGRHRDRPPSTRKRTPVTAGTDAVAVADELGEGLDLDVAARPTGCRPPPRRVEVDGRRRPRRPRRPSSTAPCGMARVASASARRRRPARGARRWRRRRSSASTGRRTACEASRVVVHEEQVRPVSRRRPASCPAAPSSAPGRAVRRRRR